jgi:MFS family permease
MLSNRTPFFYGWVVLGTSGATQVVRNAAGSLTLAIFMYPMHQDLGWNITLIAGAVSAGALASIVFSPITGWMIDRYGARVVLTSSILVLGLTTFLTGWATIPIFFYITYGIGRVIFSSPVQIGSSVVVSRWFIRRRGRANGMLSFCHSIGMTGFPLMASILIAIYGWQVTWQILGVAVWLIALLPVYFFLAETPESVGVLPDGDELLASKLEMIEPDPMNDPMWNLSSAIRTPALWQLAVGGGLLYVIHSGTNTHLAAHLQSIGMTGTIAASAVILNAVFTGVGGLCWGWLAEKIQIRFCYALVALVMAVSAMLFVFVSSALDSLLIASLFGISLGGMLVVPSVSFADYFGRESLGSIRGISEPFVGLGQAVGALMSGIIYDLTGSYHVAFYTMAILAVLTIVMTVTAEKPKIR